MPPDIATFTTSFGVFAAFVVGGFILLFSEIRRLEGKLDGGLKEMREEFRAQRAEVLAQTTALANAIVAARRVEP